MQRRKEKVIDNAWSAPLTALAGLLGVSMLIAYVVPRISTSTTLFSQLTPARFHQVLALMLVTAATVIFLAYFRAKFYFSTRWLIAATTYNFLILFVKSMLSTNELAARGSETLSTLLSTALLIGLLYVFANSLLYLFFNGKLLNRNLHKALVTSTEGKVLLAMGLFICVTLARIVVFRLPVLSSTAASSYLGDIFKTNTTLISGLLFVMIVAAVEAYAQVRRQVDLRYFFVVSTVLILIFHLTWAVFVYRGY